MRVEIEIHCFNEYDNTEIYSCFTEYSKDGNTITQSEVDDRTKKIASDALLMTSKILNPNANCCGTVNYPDGFNPMTNWEGTNYDFRFSYDKCYNKCYKS